MARKDPPQTAAALMGDTPLRLAGLLQQRIDAFARKAMNENDLEREARTIGAFARCGTGVVGFEAALRRVEAQGARAARQIEALGFGDDDNRDEGDEMERDEQSISDDDQELDEIRQHLARRTGELVAPFAAAGTLDALLGEADALAAAELAVHQPARAEAA